MEVYGAQAAGSRCPLGRWALRRRGCMSHLSFGYCVWSQQVSVPRTFQVEDRGPAEVGRLCFARFKGLLKAHFPLKKQLLLARRPSCAIA